MTQVNAPGLNITNPKLDESCKLQDVSVRVEPHALLQAVSSLADYRKALVRDQVEARLTKLDAMEPELRKVFYDTWEQAERSHREAMREAHAAERNRELQEYFKQVRMAPKPIEQRSNKEIQGEIDHAIEEERKSRGFKMLPGETEEQWRTRIVALDNKVGYLGDLLNERQGSSKVRYIEGFPSNVFEVHPKFMPPSKAEPSDVGKCLQCRAKRMTCSHLVEVEDIEKSSEECTRCLRSGAKCIVKRNPKDVDLPFSYQYALPSRRADQSEAALAEFEELSDELWAMRYRYWRITAMPSWQESDPSEITEGEDVKPKKWQDVLDGQPAKWMFSQGKSRRVMLISKIAKEKPK